MRYFFVLSFFSILFLGSGASVSTASVQDTLPRIIVTASQINFGNVPLGSFGQRSFLIINSSDTALTLSGTVSSLVTPFSIDSGGGAFTLDSGSNKRVYITFHALSLGQFQDSIVITNNSDSISSRVVVYLSGTGFIPDTTPQIHVSTQLIDYGIVYTGQSKPLQFTISNTTNTKLKLNGTVLDAHIPFHVTIGLGNFQIDSGQSKNVTVQFAPEVPGDYIDSVIVTSNADSPANRIVIRLRAKVLSNDVLKPKIGITVDTINFGQMTPNPAQTLQLFFTVKNISDTDRLLTVNILPPKSTSNFNLTGPDHLELHQFESQQLIVGFTPKAPGTYFDSIIVISDAPNSRIPIYLKAKVVPTGSVNSSTEDGSIAVYPNPARDVVVIRFESARQYKPECSIYDITGKVMLKRQLPEVSVGANTVLLEVSELPAGIYQLKIDGLQEPILRRLVIIK